MDKMQWYARVPVGYLHPEPEANMVRGGTRRRVRTLITGGRPMGSWLGTKHLGTGSPPPNLDPVRNSHTLKRIRIFVNLIMPAYRMPHAG